MSLYWCGYTVASRTENSMTGEKIYEYDLDVAGVTDYGMSLDAILAGTEPLPAQGARIDVAFEGNGSGRVSGRVRGIDYVRVRADGRIDLDIHATIETEDGNRIALAADGVAVPRAGEPIADLWENVTLSTASQGYAWVNARQVWAFGTVNFATGKIHVEAWMQ